MSAAEYHSLFFIYVYTVRCMPFGLCVYVGVQPHTHTVSLTVPSVEREPERGRHDSCTFQ